MRHHLSKVQSIAFQWASSCFGNTLATNIRERMMRFGEEANELLQSEGISRVEAHRLVDFVYDRPAGDPKQELGGAMLTLLVYGEAKGQCIQGAAEEELNRVKVLRARDPEYFKRRNQEKYDLGVGANLG